MCEIVMPTVTGHHIYLPRGSLELFFFLCLFILERERECEQGRGGEREEDMESEAGSRL